MAQSPDAIAVIASATSCRRDRCEPREHPVACPNEVHAQTWRMSLSTALLLHAGIADSRMWHDQQTPLGAAGFDVLAPDLRGFGERPMGSEPFSHARDVEALLDGPTVVVGSSLGGRVALELAVLRPDLVERLVLIAPGMR